MSAITELLAAEHRSCDEIFTVTEASAQAGDLRRCREDFKHFQSVMGLHFRKEEEELFPAFEQRSGNAIGPTRVMRLEHQQMRETLTEMRELLVKADLAGFLGQAEMLLILMQQHNIKEEQILYPMCDRILGSIAESVVEAMQAVTPDQAL